MCLCRRFVCLFVLFHELSREKKIFFLNLGFHQELGFRKKRERDEKTFSSLFWWIFDDEEKVKKPKKKKNKEREEKSYCFCCRALIARGVFERERRKRESLREFFL